MIKRRAVVGIVFALSASLLTACGFESPDVEATEHASVQAADFTIGPLDLADASVTPVGTSDTSSQRFYLIVTIINNGAASDTLTGVTSPAGFVVTLGGPGASGGQLTVPPKGIPVEIGLPSPGSTGATLALSQSPLPQAGDFVPVVFHFASAGASKLIQVPVVPAGETTAASQPVPTATASVPTEVGNSASD